MRCRRNFSVMLNFVAILEAPREWASHLLARFKEALKAYARSAVALPAGLVSAFSVVYVLMQLARLPIVDQSLPATYLWATAFPVAVALGFWGWFPLWVRARRSVEEAEKRALYAEIGQYGASSKNRHAIQHARKEKTKLEALGGLAVELDVLPLRRALADLYHPEQELISRVRHELELLNEYESVSEDDLDKERSKRVNDTIGSLNEVLQKDTTDETTPNDGNNREQFTCTLRAELKALHERVAWYDYTWAIGEWLRQCVTWWVVAALFSTFVIGVLPLVHEEGGLSIGVLHWASLGACGALLALVLELRRLDLPELGETRGKQLLQGLGGSLAIGAITAALLYFAISGEALGSRAFPDLPTTPQASDQIDFEVFRNVSLSAFWAILAGLSPGVLGRLTGLAEATLGEPKGEGE